MRGVYFPLKLIYSPPTHRIKLHLKLLGEKRGEWFIEKMYSTPLHGTLHPPLYLDYTVHPYMAHCTPFIPWLCSTPLHGTLHPLYTLTVQYTLTWHIAIPFIPWLYGTPLHGTLHPPLYLDCTVHPYKPHCTPFIPCCRVHPYMAHCTLLYTLTVQYTLTWHTHFGN